MIQIKLATICNKNGHQQDANINAELYTKWTNTTWKIFEETIIPGRIRFVKA